MDKARVGGNDRGGTDPFEALEKQTVTASMVGGGLRPAFPPAEHVG